MESPVAQKLEAILNLQNIDSRLDAIFKVRGALPEEVQDNRIRNPFKQI